jgi:hypothetical protein
MKCKLRMVALGLVVAVTLAGTTDSSASAFTKFNSELGATSFKGTQTTAMSNFFFYSGPFQCKSGTLRGMESALEKAEWETVDSWALAGPELAKHGIEFSECTYFGGSIPATFANHDCQFRFHATGLIDIVNGGGTCSTEGLTFTGAGCTVHIRPQTGLSGISFSNGGSGVSRTVTIDMNPVVGIIYTGEGCPSGGNGTFVNGSFRNASFMIGGTTNTESTMTARGVFMS